MFFPINKIIKTGNPVRQDLLCIHSKKEDGKIFFKLEKTKKTILILGGSLGARIINQLVESNIDFFNSQKVQVIWQCGKFYFEEYQKYNTLEHIQVHEFINRMDSLFL